MGRKKGNVFSRKLREMYATALQIRRIEKILKKPLEFKRDGMTDDDLKSIKRNFKCELKNLKAKFPEECLDVEALEKII